MFETQDSENIEVNGQPIIFDKKTGSKQIISHRSLRSLSSQKNEYQSTTTLKIKSGNSQSSHRYMRSINSIKPKVPRKENDENKKPQTLAEDDFDQILTEMNFKEMPNTSKN